MAIIISEIIISVFEIAISMLRIIISVFEIAISMLRIIISVFLEMLLFEARNVKIKLTQFDTKQYLLRYLENYIIMFQFSICTLFCTQNDIKLNIFELNWHKIEITICKSRFCVKIEVNQYFVYKMIIN